MIVADKTKSISEMTMEELLAINRRLSLENEVQNHIFRLKRNSGEVTGEYDYNPNQLTVDTVTPVQDLYHFGVLGMKWGVRRNAAQLDANRSIVKQRKQTVKQRRTLTNDELAEAVGRLQMEKKLRDLTREDLEIGTSDSARMLKTIGRASMTVAGTGLAVYGIKTAVEKTLGPAAAGFIKLKK